MEEDIQFNTTFDTTTKKDFERIFNWYPLIDVIAALIGLIFSILITHTIFRNALLHKRIYYRIACFSISYSIYLLLSPVLTSLYPLFENVPTELICVVIDVTFNAWFANLAFVLILLLDWYVVIHCSRPCAGKYISCLKFMVVSVIAICCCLLITTIATCANRVYIPLGTLLSLLVYVIVFIVSIALIIAHFFKVRADDKGAVYSNNIVYIVTSYMLCWLGHYITVMLNYVFFAGFHPKEKFFTIFNVASLLNPVVTFVIMYRCDNNFRQCFLKQWRKNATEIEHDKNETNEIIAS